jgi:hypothetical protein
MSSLDTDYVNALAEEIKTLQAKLDQAQALIANHSGAVAAEAS